MSGASWESLDTSNSEFFFASILPTINDDETLNNLLQVFIDKPELSKIAYASGIFHHLDLNKDKSLEIWYLASKYISNLLQKDDLQPFKAIIRTKGYVVLHIIKSFVDTFDGTNWTGPDFLIRNGLYFMDLKCTIDYLKLLDYSFTEKELFRDYRLLNSPIIFHTMIQSENPCTLR